MDDIKTVTIGEEWFEILVSEEASSHAGKAYKYSKFSGGKETTQRVIKLITQIVGEEKIVRDKREERTEANIKNSKEFQSEYDEVIFSNYGGSDTKEIFRATIPFSGDKVCAYLLGPKTPLFSFQHVMPLVGMKFIRADNWEENPRTGNFTRSFSYQMRKTDNIFMNKEIYQNVQTFTLKG